MSGGYFEYKQHYIEDIARDIESYLATEGGNLSKATRTSFMVAIETLREAAIYAQRIDWFIEGDDDEESFHKRLIEDLTVLYPIGECENE